MVKRTRTRQNSWRSKINFREARLLENLGNSKTFRTFSLLSRIYRCFCVFLFLFTSLVSIRVFAPVFADPLKVPYKKRPRLVGPASFFFCFRGPAKGNLLSEKKRPHFFVTLISKLVYRGSQTAFKKGRPLTGCLMLNIMQNAKNMLWATIAYLFVFEISRS